MSHTALAIANKVLRAARERGMPLTNMQLIKLVYIAHGWSLALRDKALVSEAPQAWQHGPVYPSIYREFRDYGWGPVTGEAASAFSDTAYEADLDADEEAIIDKVVEAYGPIHAFSLSARTHQVGTPWWKVWSGGEGKFDPIPNDLIKAHFVEINRRAA